MLMLNCIKASRFKVMNKIKYQLNCLSHPHLSSKMIYGDHLQSKGVSINGTIPDRSSGDGDGPPTKESYMMKIPQASPSADLSNIIEAETEALSHQIAGHSRTGVLKHRLGYVLKPLQKAPLGTREVDFYEQVFGNSNKNPSKTHVWLRDLVPRFFGVAAIESNGEEDSKLIKRQFLVLDDIVQGFTHPCIVDVKIGQKTWDTNASQAKIDHEKSKYRGTKEPLGISLAGMQIYNIMEQRTVKCEKEFGKALNPTSLCNAFKEFLNEKAGAHQLIAKILLTKLENISQFFNFQREYSFYSSSLLIAYDAKVVEDTDFANLLQEVDTESWLRVRMIDFAHVFPSNGEMDCNYVYGLNNTILIFSNIAEGKDKNSGSM